MKKQIEILKETAEQLTSNRSEEFVSLYFDFVDFFNQYFKKQAEEYIESLKKYPELKIEKIEEKDLEEFKKLVEKAVKWWQTEIQKELNLDLLRIWNTINGITVSNKYSLEYAKKYAGTAISWIDETTRDAINWLITSWIKESKPLESIALDIKEKFADFSLYRSTLIAQMELATAWWEWQKNQFNEYSKELWVTGYKRAMTQWDSAVRASHQANENAGWILKNLAYPWTWTMNAPHWFNCRCSDDYSLVNPETGMLYDEVPEYTEKQIQDFNENWFVDLPITQEQKELQYSLWITNEELKSINWYKGNTYININKWYYKWETDEVFQSWIQFFYSAVNKLPNYSWTTYSWTWRYYDNLVVGSILNNSAFISTTSSLKQAKEYEDWTILQFISWKGKNMSTFWNWEEEIMMMPKTLFKVDKIEEIDNIKTITLSDL